MNMSRKLRNSPDGSARRWLAGALVSVLAFALMAYGLSLRPPYVSTAVVDLGGIVYDGTGGTVRFAGFDGANEIEYFFTNEVFARDPSLNGNCTASSMYSPDGGRVQLSCKASSEEQARELALAALKPLLARHDRQYQVAAAIDAQRKSLLERQSNGYEQALDVLRQSPASAFTKVQMIDYELRLEGLRERKILDEMLGDRIRKTRVNADGVTVADRQPGARLWGAVTLLSLLAGLFVAAFPWLLQRLGHEPLRNDA